MVYAIGFFRFFVIVVLLILSFRTGWNFLGFHHRGIRLLRFRLGIRWVANGESKQCGGDRCIKFFMVRLGFFSRIIPVLGLEDDRNFTPW